MKILGYLLAFLVYSPLFAQGEPPSTTPLKIAVPVFLPPFVVQGAHRQLYGFDISMMESICKFINRACQFERMPFKDVIPTVVTKKADVGVGALVITADRSTRTNFTLPYLLSYSRFLGTHKTIKKLLTVESLNKSVIGIEEGTIFPDMLTTMGVTTAKIVNFDNLNSLVDALQAGKIDIGIMDEPSAIYWQAQSSGKLHISGASLAYGFGLGIAVNRSETALLEELNRALLHYQNSREFKRDYEKYIAHF